MRAAVQRFEQHPQLRVKVLLEPPNLPAVLLTLRGVEDGLRRLPPRLHALPRARRRPHPRKILAARHAQPTGAEVLPKTPAPRQLLLQRLGQPAEAQAHVLDALERAQDPRPEQHALLHARVQETFVRVDELVHALRVPQRLFKRVPIRLDDFAHEVVGEILEKV